MKIGIITFWEAKDNYGQILQCYALQEFLKKHGHDPFVIRYNPVDDWNVNKTTTVAEPQKKSFIRRAFKIFNPKKVYRFLECRIRNFRRQFLENKLRKEVENHPRHFEDFRNRHYAYSELRYNSYEELSKKFPSADAYITGSDQVWNPNIYPEVALNAYFLNFGDNVKRLSYAASWGIKTIDEKYKTTLTELLKNFDYISVREVNGIDLCKECGRDDAEWVPDPTMLLEKEDYEKISSEAEDILKDIKRPFIFSYFLNHTTDFRFSDLKKFARKNSLQIYHCTGNGTLDNLKKVYPNVSEWLYLIKNADYVFTNSFHCCVFSIIFRKKFMAFPVKGISAGMNERIISLFKRYNIESRFYEGDYSRVKKDYEPKPLEINLENFLNTLR